MITQEKFNISIIQQITLTSQQITTLTDRVSAIEIATDELKQSNQSAFFLNILEFFRDGLKKQTLILIWKSLFEVIVVLIYTL